MTAIYLSFALPFVALAAWFLGVFSEHKKKSVVIQALETKARLHENRTLDLQQMLAKTRENIESLNKTLNEEKEAKYAALGDLNTALKKGTMAAGVCLFAGLLLGGTVSWFWAVSAVEAKNNRYAGQLEISTRIAEVKADILAKQLDRLQTKYEALQTGWYQLLEEKIVAQAKLDILLENMTMGKEGQPVLDYKKMKKNWQKENDLKESKHDSAFFGIPFPKA